MGFASFSISSMFERAFSVLVLTAIAATEARPDFDKCFTDFTNTQRELGTYDKNKSIIYQGLTYFHHNPTPDQRRFIVSTEGCQILCGSEPQYYPWNQIAATITTWVLPIIGTLLQAPYEGNEFRNTLYALVRWIGSPIASLSYILWNIKVSGKCALLSDMSTFYNIDLAKLRLEGARQMEDVLDMRDALYILSVMNQYTVKSQINPEEAETLLRKALFADIPLYRGRTTLTGKTLSPGVRFEGNARPAAKDITTETVTETVMLKKRRQKLALTLREGRKRGIVPVFVTLMWFMFSLAISIEGAFSSLGENFTAHDLALGMLLAWFPVLILSSIVDRNPTQTARSCAKLNKYLREVEVALLADEMGFDQRERSPLASGFFCEFAGQGRIRWHYGVAHPILAGMESIILDRLDQQNARKWLQIPGIRNDLIQGPGKEVLLLHFDLREFWEILSAFLIVAGTISGAFVLSFRTPTIGLGCRAGGYAIFGILATGIFALELLTWYFIVAPTKKDLNRIGEQITRKSRKQKEKVIATLNWIFRLMELTSTGWLVYIVMAQTIGSYRTCECQSSTWGRDGGYIDAQIAVKANGNTVEPWWITGVLMSSLIMFTAIAFLVVEWCEQSHLNSLDLDKAIHGLKVTQRFKYHTLWIRRIPDSFVHLCKRLWRTFRGCVWNQRYRKTRGRESIRWSN